MYISWAKVCGHHVDELEHRLHPYLLTQFFLSLNEQIPTAMLNILVESLSKIMDVILTGELC